MRYCHALRALCGTILATSVVVFSGSAGSPARAATTVFGQVESPNTLRGQPRSFVRDANTASTGDIIVSTNYDGLYIYSNALHLIGQLSVAQYGEPAGLALDSTGNLYVANSGTHGIPVFKNDYKTQIATLSAPTRTFGVAVKKNGVVGTVGGTNITFYPSGGTTPCATLSVPGVEGFLQGAFDSADNFYVTGNDSKANALIGVVRGGCSATEFTQLTTANPLENQIFGIQVTQSGKIAIEAQDYDAIYTYDPPVNNSLGQPIATTTFPPNTPIEQFGFTEKGAFVFVDLATGTIEKFAYPQGGTPLQSFGQKQLQGASEYGLVVAPPAQP